MSFPDPALSAIIDDAVQPYMAKTETVGLVVGTIVGDRKDVFAYGLKERGGDQAPDGETIFEIGSITKTFTALAMLDMAREGRLGIDDPIGKCLPAREGESQPDWRSITIRELATHTSGLPRLPENLRSTGWDPKDPYAHYSWQHMLDFLSGWRRPEKRKCVYSNLGYGLLGYVLSQVDGRDYCEIIRARVCLPLGMTATTVGAPRETTASVATGHDKEGEPTADWTFAPAMQGCGSLHSNADDMLKCLAANMGVDKCSLTELMRQCREPQASIEGSRQRVAWAWHVMDGGEDGDIVWHNGGTGGFRSFMGFNATCPVGVVLLSNSSAHGVTIDQLGLRILDLLRRQVAESPNPLAPG